MHMAMNFFCNLCDWQTTPEELLQSEETFIKCNKGNKCKENISYPKYARSIEIHTQMFGVTFCCERVLSKRDI